MIMTRHLVYNAMRTPDGTLLVSRSVHDCVFHTDDNGKEYMNDGGLNYLHRTVYGDEVDESVYFEDGHEKVREVLQWGTYGKNGDQPLKRVAIKDMEDDHLQACLDNVPSMRVVIRLAMENELRFRKGLDTISEIKYDENMETNMKEDTTIEMYLWFVAIPVLLFIIGLFVFN